MKATFEIPEDLHRRLKAKSALEGRPVREVAIQLFQEWVGETGPLGEGKPAVTVYDLTKDAYGVIDSGVLDLATNPEHLEAFGRDSLDDR